MMARSSLAVRIFGFSIAAASVADGPRSCARHPGVPAQGVDMANAAAERQRVRALIERASVAMLINVDERGAHTGRPMLPLFLQNDPHIYFLTHQSSRKVTQLTARPQVGLTIVSANCYIVMAGSVHISPESELIRRLWRPTYRAWFPEGKDDRE